MSICVSVSVSVETSLSACMFIRVNVSPACIHACIYMLSDHHTSFVAVCRSEKMVV